MAEATEHAPFVVHERLVLKKFTGDLTPEEMEATTPVEALVVEGGVVVQRWTPEEGMPCPE